MAETDRQDVAIVTGAARGIGLAIVHAFVRAGWNVGMIDRDKAELAVSAADIKSNCATHIEAVAADLALADEATRAVSELAELFGSLTALVNNAGGSADTPLSFDDVSPDDLERVLADNLKATFFCCQAALPWLRAREGTCIVNLSAISGRAGTELLSAQYSAAKAGVIGLTRNLARQLGPSGIRVNSVAPGFTISGERVERAWQRHDPEAVLRQIPLRRRAKTDEIASAVLYLASPAASYVSGAVLDVNGGFFSL